MDSRKVETHGLHLVRRTDGVHDDVINQREGLAITDEAVSIAMIGNDSGQRRAFVETDPAVIDHYRRKDHAQYVIALSQRPEVPEPDRLAIGRVPDGYRLCWLCEGSKLVEDEFGFDVECANCGGEGVVPAQV